MRTFLAASLIAIAAPLSLASTGCDSGDEPTDDEAADAGDDAASSRACEGETRDDFSIGLMREGEMLQVAIGDAFPADPIRGDNEWRLLISQDDAAMDNATIEIKPWMPDHGHGTPVPIEVTPLGDGEYMVQPLNLFMAGLWELTFTVTLADGSTDEVMFSTCVE